MNVSGTQFILKKDDFIMITLVFERWQSLSELSRMHFSQPSVKRGTEVRISPVCLGKLPTQ